jgi:hypothetical protein
MDKSLETSRRYTSAIIKGGGLVEPTRHLLGQWRPDEPPDDFARRVQSEGFFCGSTAGRTSDVVRRVFIRRFLRPDPKPALILQRVLAKGLPDRVFTDLLFLYAARQDPLVYDFTLSGYWPAVRRGGTVMDIGAVLTFLSEAHCDGSLDKDWSGTVAGRVACGVLGLLRDGGLLRGGANGCWEIARYRMSDESVAIAARELSEAGVTDSSLCGHRDWGLFGMAPEEVAERLDGPGGRDVAIVQRAGSVTSITWLKMTMEETIDALSRCGLP